MKRHGLELSIIFLAVASVATSQDTAGWKNCTDDQYGVTFQYPNHWQRSDRYTDIEFEGPDGSVQVDASEGSSLKTICRGAANHKMKPYGEHPHIQFLKVHDLPACIVWPSADQGAPHLAELIVEYQGRSIQLHGHVCGQGSHSPDPEYVPFHSLGQQVTLCSEQIRNAVKCDPRWRGLVCGEHSRRSQSAYSVFLVELVHRLEQLRPALRVIERIKQVQRVQTVRHQPIQAYAYEIGLVITFALRLVIP